MNSRGQSKREKTATKKPVKKEKPETDLKRAQVYVV